MDTAFGSLFENCLKRNWTRCAHDSFQKLLFQGGAVLSQLSVIILGDKKVWSVLRESSFAVREEDFLQNDPFPLMGFFSKYLAWAFHNSALMKTKTFWLIHKQVPSNWNPLFVIPYLTKTYASQLFTLECKDIQENQY